MAADSYGSKNQPHFAETGTPDIAGDPTLVSDYAANVGNRKVGLSSARTALSGSDVWDGLQFSETDTKATYLYSVAGGGWLLRSQPLTAWTPTIGNVATSSVYARYKVTDGVVHAFIRVVVSGAPSLNPTATLPIPADTAGPLSIGAPATMTRSSDGTAIDCAALRTSSTQVAWYPNFTTGTPAYVRQGLTVNSTSPFTWTSGDVIDATLTYPLP